MNFSEKRAIIKKRQKTPSFARMDKLVNAILSKYIPLSDNTDSSTSLCVENNFSMVWAHYHERIWLGNDFVKRDEVFNLLKSTISQFDGKLIFGDMMVQGEETEGVFFSEEGKNGIMLGYAEEGKTHYWKN